MNEPTQKRAQELQYSFRSGFFYRRRLQFKSWLGEVETLSKYDYDWGDSDQLGISEAAWRRAQTAGLAPATIFCHPEVIGSSPHSVGYYRCVAALPNNGTQRLAFDTGPIEEGRTKSLSPLRASALAKLFNSYISDIIESEPEFSSTDARMLAMMNFGAQINGKWRNQIGTEGGLRVKGLLLAYLRDNELVSEIVSKDAREFSRPLSESQLPEVHKVVLTNGYQLVFGSEPDASILDESGTLQAALEVKAGLDPAGALERYGAAKKSFDRALDSNKSAETIYLASCITPAVKSQISRDRLVRRHFDLTRIFLGRKERDKFLSHIRWLLRL